MESQHFTGRTGELNFSFMINYPINIINILVPSNDSIPCTDMGTEHNIWRPCLASTGLQNSLSCLLCCWYGALLFLCPSAGAADSPEAVPVFAEQALSSINGKF